MKSTTCTDSRQAVSTYWVSVNYCTASRWHVAVVSALSWLLIVFVLFFLFMFLILMLFDKQNMQLVHLIYEINKTCQVNVDRWLAKAGHLIKLNHLIS